MSQPLALELYYLIIRHVDNKTDLCSLALCCSAFRDEAQQCLFREITTNSVSLQSQLISIITASPSRLGPWVHTLHVKIEKRDKKQEASISLALHAMYNLKHLQISTGRPSRVLDGCTFALQTLVFRSGLDESELLYLLYEFLPTQQSIVRLQAPYIGYPTYSFTGVEVLNNLCPKLDFLGTNDRRFASVLLRDTRLITRFECKDMAPALPNMSTRQFRHLEYLFFSIYHSQTDTTFTRHLSSLVVLELYITLHDASYLYPNILFLHDIPRLRVLIMTIRILNTPGHSVLGGNFELLPTSGRAFELRPTLEYIDVRHGETTNFYRRFRPGIGNNNASLSDRTVHMQEVLEWRL